MDAKRQNLDDAICGDCKLRGHDGVDSGCYLAVWQAPHQVWKRFKAGGYPDVTWPELQAVVEGRAVRLCAYGDMAAAPFELWRTVLATTSTYVAYSHQWRVCDPRLKAIAMASVDTIDEFHAAHLAGWRTFRIRLAADSLLVYDLKSPTSEGKSTSVPLEFACPASEESGHRTTCTECRLCRGTSSPARSVAIVAHGKPSNLKAFGIDITGLMPRRQKSAIDRVPSEPIIAGGRKNVLRNSGWPSDDASREVGRNRTGGRPPADPPLMPLLRSHDYGKEAGERLAKVRP